jgi:hypothetical protein
MRVIFGVLSLIAALAVVALLSKQQIQAVQVPSQAGAASVPLGATPAQQSQALQRKVQEDIGKIMEQAPSRGDAQQ